MVQGIAVYMITTLLLTAAFGTAYADDGRLAMLETGLGKIVIEFFPEDAPNHVARFKNLAESGFYDGTVLYNAVPGFTVQGRHPGGAPGMTADAEFNTIKHNRGIVLMAGTQFIMVHENTTDLGVHYTPFGRIATEEGFKALDRMVAAGAGGQRGSTPTDPELIELVSVRLAERFGVPGLLELPGPERRGAAVPGPAEVYLSPDQDVSFTVPADWTLRTRGNKYMVMEGPQSGLIPPKISIEAKHTQGRTFDEMVAEMTGMPALTFQTLPEFILSRVFEMVVGMTTLPPEMTKHFRISGSYGNAVTTSSRIGEIDGMDLYQRTLQLKFKPPLSPLRHWVDSPPVEGTFQFSEMLFYDPRRSYVVSYSNDLSDFGAREPAFEEVLDTLVLSLDAYHRAKADVSHKFDAGFEEKIQGLIDEGPGDGGEYRHYDVVAIVYGSANKAAVVEILEHLGAINISPASSLSFVTASVPIDRIHELAQYDEVYQVGDGEIQVTPEVTLPVEPTIRTLWGDGEVLVTLDREPYVTCEALHCTHPWLDEVPPLMWYLNGTPILSPACTGAFVSVVSPSHRPACVSKATASALEGRGYSRPPG